MVSDLKGTDIILNEPVTVINYDQECATVLSMNNNVYQGKYLIIAIPPVLASKIHYHPSLGSQYYGLLQNFPCGDALKIHFVYERPFWIENNNSGNVYLQEGWLTEVTDNTTPSDPRAILTGFIYGNKKEWIGYNKLDHIYVDFQIKYNYEESRNIKMGRNSYTDEFKKQIVFLILSKTLDIYWIYLILGIFLIW